MPNVTPTRPYSFRVTFVESSEPGFTIDGDAVTSAAAQGDASRHIWARFPELELSHDLLVYYSGTNLSFDDWSAKVMGASSWKATLLVVLKYTIIRTWYDRVRELMIATNKEANAFIGYIAVVLSVYKTVAYFEKIEPVKPLEDFIVVFGLFTGVI